MKRLPPVVELQVPRQVFCLAMVQCGFFTTVLERGVLRKTPLLLIALCLSAQVTLSYGVFEGKLNVIKLQGPFSPEEDPSR